VVIYGGLVTVWMGPRLHTPQGKIVAGIYRATTGDASRHLEVSRAGRLRVAG